MARLRSQNVDQEDIDEALDELDQNIKRLRIEYEQHFAGTLRRPPSMLQGQVQKVIQRFSAEAPRSTRQKFRFNQLNSRYQVFRQQWGRTLRQIEEGTFKPHRFKVRLHEQDRVVEKPAAAPAAEPKASKGLDALYGALVSAREKVGEKGAPDRAKLEELVRRQTAEIRAKHGDAKIKFKVVTENGRAKVKATVSKN